MSGLRKSSAQASDRGLSRDGTADIGANFFGKWAGLGAALLLGATSLNAQIITLFDPPVGSPGELVTIYGDGFYPGTVRVNFNGVPAPAQATSPTVIQAQVPNGATTGPITVQVGAGTATSAQDFTVIGPGPFITDLLPAFGAVNESIIIRGYHLVNPNNTSPTVRFSGILSPGAIANSTGTQVTARVPAGATNGPISVTTVFGTSNSPISFTVIGPGPYVAGFTPQAGNAGTRVFIRGVHLLTATGVTFNGKPGLNFLPSDTEIQVDAPPGVTTGPIVVLSPLGNHTNAANFFVPPAIASFSPGIGRAGTNVVITGTNFLGATTVRFANTAAEFVPPASNATIVATVPVGASSGPIRVITPAGSAITTTNFRIPPTITGFTPSGGSTGRTVVITGANLNEGLSSITFGGVQAAFATASFGLVTSTVPAAAISGPISVTTTNGTFTTATNFFVAAEIASFTPTNGTPGTTVKIAGRNFLGVTSIDFGGVPAASFSETNNTSLTAVVPQGAVTGPIGVTTPAGTSYSKGLFYAPPLVFSFSPGFGMPGTNVTVFGTNLLGTRTVLFGGVAATSFTATNNGSIRATVPPGAQTGPITVVAPGGTISTSLQFLIGSEADLAHLTIQRVPQNQVRISWPSVLTNYTLQSRTNFTSTSQWASVTNPPVVSGEELSVTETNSGASRFYRLKK